MYLRDARELNLYMCVFPQKRAGAALEAGRLLDVARVAAAADERPPRGAGAARGAPHPASGACAGLWAFRTRWSRISPEVPFLPRASPAGEKPSTFQEGIRNRTEQNHLILEPAGTWRGNEPNRTGPSHDASEKRRPNHVELGKIIVRTEPNQTYEFRKVQNRNESNRTGSRTGSFLTFATRGSHSGCLRVHESRPCLKSGFCGLYPWRHSAGAATASREPEYRIPGLHYHVNFRKFPEILGDVCKDKTSFLHVLVENRFLRFAPVDFRRKPDPVLKYSLLNRGAFSRPGIAPASTAVARAPQLCLSGGRK